MYRGGYRGGGGPRGGDRDYHGGPLPSYQSNGRHEGPQGNWGPPESGGWNSRGPGGGSRMQGRGRGYSSSNSGRCWGRDEGPGGTWQRGRGAPRGARSAYGRRRGRGGAPEGHYSQQAEYTREESVKMAEAPPSQKQAAPPFCQNFAFYGECRFGNRCRYSHALECVGYQEEAHGGKGIRCCVVNPSASELFTGGKDKKLMRWQISQPPAQGPGGPSAGAEGTDLDSTGEPLLALTCLTCTEMGAEGHEKSVYALLLVEGVLVSGDWGGSILFWRFNESQQTFTVIHTLQAKGNICCLQTADIAVPQQLPAGTLAATPPATRKVLWVGGTALCIVDLQAMQVVRELDVSDVKGSGPPLVLSILPFNDFLLVGFASGAITAYTADGERQYCFSSDYLSTMEGLISPAGPVLVYGGRRSSIRVLKVPEFEDKGSLPAHETGDLKAVAALGTTHFVTCGDDGAIAIWKWAQVQGESPPKS